uniref:Sushi domain-containing protein n=1 Tax=Ficedula albicollis TaxID=59894 RepID=A0A803VN41_FICAL
PGAGHSPGSLVLYSCAEGYSLRGNASIRCTAKGTWSRPQPRCQATGCTRPEIENGKVSGLETTYMLEDTIFFECNFGYALNGSQGSQCQFGGKWHPPVPTCEKLLQCPSPPNIDKGNHNSQDLEVFPTGMVVNYSCDPGYSLQGQASIYCTDSGNWSLPLPQCAVLHCSKPANITNGSFSGPAKAVFTPGTSVNYICEPGFSLLGTASIYCTASGAWSHPPPVCQEIRCEFPDVQGVKKAIKGNTYRSGTNVTLECDDGYMLEGISHTQCQEDFSWDPPVPACKLSEWNANKAENKQKHANALPTCKYLLGLLRKGSIQGCGSEKSGVVGLSRETLARGSCGCPWVPEVPKARARSSLG